MSQKKAAERLWAVTAGDWFRCIPYVVLISEHDNGPGIGRLQQASDNLVKLPRPGLPGDLQGLGNAHTTWYKQTETDRMH